jgi:radical SAM protein with 4Fe4S-binding SPASM domain
MSPSKRTPCARLSSRVIVLCEGRVVACENDLIGKSALGRIGDDSLAEIWQKRLGPFRADHSSGNWNRHALCASCKDWHRP